MSDSLITLSPIEYFKGLGAVVTSPYGMRACPFCGGKSKTCSHCNGAGKVMHWGTDLDFPGPSRGLLWRVPYPGTVTHTGTHGGRGKVAVVRILDLPLLQLFQHLDEFRCRPGDKLEQGDPVGTNGVTGQVTGAHLHYEIRIDNGTPLGAPVWGDPASFTIAKWKEESEMKEYVVQKNDTLATIAARFNISPWQKLVEWNRDRYPDIGTGNNALIRVGWKLRLYDPREQGPKPEVSKEEFEQLKQRVQNIEAKLAAVKKAL